MVFLSGAIGVGKTSVGRTLARALGYGFVDGDAHAAPGQPWYCSALRCSAGIVSACATHLRTAAVPAHGGVVVAYPVRCISWIYFRRHLEDHGVRSVFVGMVAPYAAIVDPARGRAFSSAEHARIREMIFQGYGRQSFLNLVIEADTPGIATTTALLVQRLAPLGVRTA